MAHFQYNLRKTDYESEEDFLSIKNKLDAACRANDIRLFLELKKERQRKTKQCYDARHRDTKRRQRLMQQPQLSPINQMTSQQQQQQQQQQQHQEDQTDHIGGSNRNVIGRKIATKLNRKESDNNQLLKAKIRKYASVQHNASQKAKDREGRSTQLSNLSTSDEKSSPKRDAAVEKSASSTASPKSFPRPVVGASTEQIIRLTKEQCSKVTFPIGCPVWYDFSVKDCEKTTTLKCGLISSAMLQGSQLFYEVEHRNKDDTHVTEQVQDSELCFGASCPVTISPSSDNSGGCDDDKNTSSYCEGEIVLCTPSTTDMKKFVYTAMIFLDGGSRVRYESGIEANRVKYRRVESDEMVENSKATRIVSSENPVSASEEKDHHSPRANNNGGVTTTPVANISPLPTKGLGNRFVPPVISVGNSNSGSVDSVSSRKRARSENDTSTTVKEESTPSPQKKYPMDDPDLEIDVPLWLQKDVESQRRLFRYLLGKRAHNLKRISREALCHVSIAFDDKGDSLIPMKIHIKSHSERSRLSDLKQARLILEGLFLNFVGKDEGCRGRLVYELARSTGWGAHIPKKSTSNAVRGINPMSNDSSETYMSVVELPSHYASMERHHNRRRRGRATPPREIRNIAEANGCKEIIVRRDNTQMCDPYVLIYAKSYENVDRSVTILEDKISQSKTQTPLRETEE